MHIQAGAAQEWRRFWFLPLVGALGYSSAVLHTYGVGPFFEPLQREFGWSRAGISFGLTIAGLVGALFAIPMGMVVDRLGPRRVALAGTLLMPASIGLLGTASGTLTNWYVLWGLVAFANLWMQATVWTSAIASRFEKSRGIAFAVTFSGASFSAVVVPFVATSLIIAFDWRTAFMLVGVIWAVAVFPLVFLFFRGAQDVKTPDEDHHRPAAADLPGASVEQALRSPAFYQLFFASLLFTFTAVGMIVHYVPILMGQGASALGAAGVAAFVGVFSIIGRLGTGFLLDRFPPGLVGAAAFMLPVISCLLLLFDGADPVSQSIASALFGFTVGAEVDVIAFLATRQFGLKHYGVIFGSIVTAMAAGGAIGPLAAGAAHDHFGSYSQFLTLTIALMVASALAVATLRRPSY
ncbi:MFS transporter [Novosphingobium sp. PC22D]|uniref:MFS transporter n=1 Tax=Novosphingobium sp. PC22D TaxID=1962403 RepID=UPI000BF1EF5A|nr:MFS transporter [Novosphingobium sp. PC22D]PEQ13915.1 MFS transporter [Novosphingobium sp. PC22D]